MFELHCKALQNRSAGSALLLQYMCHWTIPECIHVHQHAQSWSSSNRRNDLLIANKQWLAAIMLKSRIAAMLLLPCI
jgi:hypothetical protein